MWFHALTGFSEESPDQVRANLTVNGNTLKSRVNGAVWTHGELEIPSLGQLRDRVRSTRVDGSRFLLRDVVSDVKHLHCDSSNAGSFFQVASQFNLLEMITPAVTPERGVEIYENDNTQGPACAIAAGAGTIFRNYFAIVNGQVGQSAGNQIDCLADIGAELGNAGNRLWDMRNGYALPSHEGLAEISSRLQASSESEIDVLRSKLRIGIQWDTQVTLSSAGHLVSQCYCSALPVRYTPHSLDMWEPFARLVLEAAYEATVCAAILNSMRTGNNKLFLTLLGGGAFGNAIEWIIAALRRALDLYKLSGLDIAIVSFGSSNAYIRELVDEISDQA
jgi:hypothetical protein